ncbi:hypothetical protein Ddye_001572 [Dipteronia dyeriana]|uniref:Uncharacterized protein n=1 Tax=Dipteronia dyeriana TaxID=168575 RepID=A0AAE0CU43_9ROSI|nr:hypothetical protein Ddye_001572 [Dipteronia dyeriana]
MLASRTFGFRGTTASPVAVKLACSRGIPCQGVEIADIDISDTQERKLVQLCPNAVMLRISNVSFKNIRISGYCIIMDSGLRLDELDVFRYASKPRLVRSTTSRCRAAVRYIVLSGSVTIVHRRVAVVVRCLLYSVPLSSGDDVVFAAAAEK